MVRNIYTHVLDCVHVTCVLKGHNQAIQQQPQVVARQKGGREQELPIAGESSFPSAFN